MLYSRSLLFIYFIFHECWLNDRWNNLLPACHRLWPIVFQVEWLLIHQSCWHILRLWVDCRYRCWGRKGNGSKNPEPLSFCLYLGDSGGATVPRHSRCVLLAQKTGREKTVFGGPCGSGIACIPLTPLFSLPGLGNHWLFCVSDQYKDILHTQICCIHKSCTHLER